jgi:hypothetical protein
VPHNEESPLLDFDDPVYGTTSRAVSSMENQIMNNSAFVGVVLRNGLLYGAGTGFDTAVEFVPPVHVDAAAHAAFLALNCQSNAIYNIADDDERLSTEKAKSELRWNPNYRMNK